MDRKSKLKLYKELQLALAAVITLTSPALDAKAATTMDSDVKAYATNFEYATAGIGVEMVSKSEDTKKKNRKERRAEKRK